MPPRPDPPVFPDPGPLSPDKRLWLGLASGFALIVLLALAVHWLVPASPRSPGSPGSPGAASKGTLNGNAPLMTRPQLLENQQAMPELMDFDAQTPPPNPDNGSGPLASPRAPSSLGAGALGR